MDEFHEKPFHGFEEFVDGGKPLLTRTGKIELFSYVVGDESERGKLHIDDYRRLVDNLPNPRWTPQNRPYVDGAKPAIGRAPKPREL